MCEFPSFRIETGKDGCKLVFAKSMDSHHSIPGNGHEGEWPMGEFGERDSDIRVPTWWSENLKDELIAMIKRSFPTREKLIKYGMLQVLSRGEIPDHFFEFGMSLGADWNLGPFPLELFQSDEACIAWMRDKLESLPI